MPGKSHGWRNLVGCSPWGLEESDTTEWLHFHFSLSCTGEGNGNPLQCSCLENPRDGGAWWAPIYGVVQSRTRLKWLSSSRQWFLACQNVWNSVKTINRRKCLPLNVLMRKDETPKDKDPNIHLKWAKEQQIKLKENNKEQKLVKEKTNVEQRKIKRAQVLKWSLLLESFNKIYKSLGRLSRGGWVQESISRMKKRIGLYICQAWKRNKWK